MLKFLSTIIGHLTALKKETDFSILSFHMHSFLTAILTDMYCIKVLVSVPYMHLGEKINGFPVSRMPNEFPKKHFYFT